MKLNIKAPTAEQACSAVGALIMNRALGLYAVHFVFSALWPVLFFGLRRKEPGNGKSLLYSFLSAPGWVE